MKMILVVSCLMYITNFFMSYFSKKSFTIDFFFNKFKDIPVLKKFFYTFPLSSINLFKTLKFKHMYKLSRLLNFSIDTIGMLTFICIKNYQHNYTNMKLTENSFKPFLFINLVLLKNKLQYSKKTYLLGSFDSLSFFSTKFKFPKFYKFVFKNVEKKLKMSMIFTLKPLLLSYSKKFSLKFLVINKNLLNWAISFSTTTIEKLTSIKNLNRFLILYLRKNKVFNKGRYSRNRQTYRTGVYWCIYINVILVIGLYFWFYRFSINFGYIWWFFYFFINIFIIVKIIRFRFYSYSVLAQEFFLNSKWLGDLIKNNFTLFIKLTKKLMQNLTKFYYISFYLKKVRFFQFVDFFVYPILFMFLHIKILLFKFNRLVSINEYIVFYYSFLDCYLFRTDHIFIIKNLFANIMRF